MTTPPPTTTTPMTPMKELTVVITVVAVAVAKSAQPKRRVFAPQVVLLAYHPSVNWSVQ